MSRYQDEPLSGLISTAKSATTEAQTDFGELTPEQLNWKPGADRWSVAQCLDHLVTANESYFPIFEQVLNGDLQTTVWQRLPWFPSLWGKMLLNAVSPETARKSKAPKMFQPESSNLDGAILQRFLDQQTRTIGYMEASTDLDLEGIIIPSPVTNLISYSLIDAYRIIVAHEKRHLLQAKRVMETDGFPA